MKRFRDLRVGETFEFASYEKWPYSGMERGPWVKVSVRKYEKDTTPFSDCPDDQLSHQQWVGVQCQVGTINVEVLPLPHKAPMERR